MRTLLMVSLMCCTALFARATKPPGDEWKAVSAFELYSWQSPQGTWNFCLLGNTDRQKTVEEVLSEKTSLHGVEELKRKISKLPRSSRIVWFDRLTWGGVKLKGSEGLKYPPKEIVDEVKRCAEARGIKFFGPPE